MGFVKSAENKLVDDDNSIDDDEWYCWDALLVLCVSVVEPAACPAPSAQGSYKLRLSLARGQKDHKTGRMEFASERRNRGCTYSASLSSH